MNCAEVGLLRAYADGEVEPEARQALDEHLAGCEACRERLEALATDTAQARRLFDYLAPAPGETVMPVVALRAWRERARTEQGMWQRIRGGLGTMNLNAFGARWRVAAASLAAVVIAFSLVFTPAGSALAGWLSVFRAEKFAPVTIDPAATSTAGARDLEPEDFGAFQVKKEPTVTKVADPTGAQVGFAVRQPTYVPSGLTKAPEASVSSAGEAAFQFDRAKSQAAFASMGVNAQLPASMDGAVARVKVPAGVQQAFTGPSGSGKGLVFIQSGVPTVEMPAFLDSRATRDLFYSLAGVPAELVEQLEAIAETGNTAPVPVMKGDVAKAVKVDNGADGVLVTHRPASVQKDAPEGSYLIWQKNGVVHVLGGTVSDDELVKVANSLK